MIRVAGPWERCGITRNSYSPIASRSSARRRPRSAGGSLEKGNLRRGFAILRCDRLVPLAVVVGRLWAPGSIFRVADHSRPTCEVARTCRPQRGPPLSGGSLVGLRRPTSAPSAPLLLPSGERDAHLQIIAASSTRTTPYDHPAVLVTAVAAPPGRYRFPSVSASCTTRSCRYNSQPKCRHHHATCVPDTWPRLLHRRRGRFRRSRDAWLLIADSAS